MNTTGFQRGDRVRLVDSVDTEYDTYLGLQLGITEGVVAHLCYISTDIIAVSVLWDSPRIEIPHWASELRAITNQQPDSERTAENS